MRPLFIYTCEFDSRCAEVRIHGPERFLRTIPGVRASTLRQRFDPTLAGPDEEKVFIWQRAALTKPEGLPYLKDLLRSYLLVAEWDDDPGLASPAAAGALTFAGCHCVQTSTEPLAEVLRQFNPHVQVFPNQVEDLPPPREYSDDNHVTLFFGALNRQKAWQPLMPALNRVLARFRDQVRVRVVWDFGFYFALQTQNKEFEPYCPYERYLAILRECDIALLPLEPTRYDSMKSDLKFIECAAQGVATLASPTVYERTIRAEETGLLFQADSEFESQLIRIIENRDLRHRLARNAYDYVAESRLLDQHFRKRHDWYLAMRDRLPELNAELGMRVPELFES